MSLSKKLDLEFINHSPFALSSYSWLSLIILTVGLMMATVIWQQYQIKHIEFMAISNQLNVLVQQTEYQTKPQSTSVKATSTVISAEKKLQTQTIVTALIMPWNKLLQAIEGADNKDIALLNLVPNTKSQQVILSGEGKNLQTVLSYVNQLQAQPMLEKVYLQKHTVDTSNISKPVKFTIFTQWQSAEN